MYNCKYLKYRYYLLTSLTVLVQVLCCAQFLGILELTTKLKKMLVKEKESKMKQTIVLGILMVMSLSFYSCQEKESSSLSSGGAQKHPVHLSMGGYTTAKFSPMNFIIPSAYAAVSDLKFCFKRLRFKRDLPDGQVDSTNDNVDLELGEKVISDLGTDLGTVSVPADTYKRIEFDLEPGCDGVATNSVSLVNDSGSFNSTSTITIKFEGTFIVSGEENLELGTQNILDAANAFDGMGGQSLKEALEAVSGNL